MFAVWSFVILLAGLVGFTVAMRRTMKWQHVHGPHVGPASIALLGVGSTLLIVVGVLGLAVVAVTS